MACVGDHLTAHGSMVATGNTFQKNKKANIFHLDGELVYRDTSGGLSILEVETLTVKVLMTNSTFVSELITNSIHISKQMLLQRQLNAEKFLVAPDLKYVLLLADGSLSGSK